MMHMKTITIKVSEPTYREFQQFAKQRDRSTSELIRQAMEEYRERHMRPRPSLRNIEPTSVGKVLKPLGPDDDTLGEMLNDLRG